MNNFVKFYKQVLADIYSTKHYSFIILLVAFSWCYLVGVAYLANAFGFYSLNKLFKVFILLPVLYIILAWLVGHFLLTPQENLNRQRLLRLLIPCTVILCLVIVVFPPPLPGLAQEHQLKLVVSAEKNELSSGAGIVIAKLRNLDGRSIPWDDLVLTGDWQVIDKKLVSTGKEPSTLEYSGPVYGGVVINLLYDKESGKIQIYWDDISQDIDLYAPWPTVLNSIYKLDPLRQLDPLQVIIILAGMLLYSVAIASLVLLLVFVVELRGSKRLKAIIVVMLYILTFVLFVKLKSLYPTFDAERTFRDTYSYVAGAEKSLSDIEFWIGERSFTLPLIFKLLGVTTLNYQSSLMMREVMQFQTWLSIACWALLGLALGISIRDRWLGIGVFGTIVFFSLSLEISLWDSLLLSESVSLSLFACLVGFWIILEMFHATNLRSVTGWLVYLLLLVVTVLYSFTRDTNLYFVLICGPIFALLAWLKKKDQLQRISYSIYALFVLALFVFQSYSVSSGNRWQILIYDQLALRLLKDDKAVDFFTRRGLPVGEALMSVTQMTPPEFQKYFLTSENMQGVREWVNSQGKTTYLQYLLLRPLKSLVEPISASAKLINGGSMEYRREELPVRPIPKVITRISNIFYPRSPIILGLMLAISITGATWWLHSLEKVSVWLIVLALVVSIYPMMFITWHGNPQEVERHAVQIAVQIRLAGWMAVVVWLAWLSLKIESGLFSNIE
jgi:hypothetical protein